MLSILRMLMLMVICIIHINLQHLLAMPAPHNNQSVELAELERMLLVERIPHKPWNEVKFDIYKRWRPKDSPHHSIISLSGGGKSYLATRGLLPMRGWRRNLIIDVKGDDETLKDVGKRVRELPKNDPW